MNYQSALLSSIYSLGQITLGLLLHPYQTMQSLVQDKIFVWMSLLPSMILALITLCWRFLLVPGVSLVFSCYATNFFLCNYLSFVSNILSFFCIYWQLMLLYLLLRFTQAYRE